MGSPQDPEWNYHHTKQQSPLQRAERKSPSSTLRVLREAHEIDMKWVSTLIMIMIWFWLVNKIKIQLNLDELVI